MKKKLFLLGVTLFLGVYFSYGQPPERRSPEERADHETEMMKSKLGLNEDQVVKVKEINLKYAKQKDELFKPGEQPEDFDQVKTKLDNIDKEERKEMATVLTSDQLTKYDEMVEDRRKNHQGPPQR